MVEHDRTQRRRVLLLTSTEGWHEAKLREAFVEAGCDYTRLSLNHIDFAHTKTGFTVRAQPDHALSFNLPDIVFVRTIDSGSFEQITRRLAVLHALVAQKVLVTNSPSSIERTVDKGHTSHILRGAGISTPPTLTTESYEAACDFANDSAKRGDELVLKPLFGAQGQGIRRIKDADDLPTLEQVNGVYHLQRFVTNQYEGEWRDYRVLVSASQVVGVMTRLNDHWITNRAKGARCLPIESAESITTLAVQATEALGVDYAGVDIIRDVNQRDYVLEVNSIPAWRGLQGLTPHSIARTLATTTLNRFDLQNR